MLCHRDYHSRNLVVRDGGLAMVDIQDARWGPDSYDLASLLKDAYVDIADGEAEELLERYLDGLSVRPERGDFRERFDLVAAQRMIKALGTFGYQTTTRSNPVYIQYMPRTLRYVRNNLEHHPERSRLRELLSAYVDELK